MDDTVPPNKHNTLELTNGRVVKKGPASILRGQEFFYKTYPRSLRFFPEYYTSSESNGTMTIEMEHIRGVSLFRLLRDRQFTTGHIDMLFDMMNVLHTTPSPSTAPTKEQVGAMYVDKFRARLSDASVYPFSQTQACLEGYTKKLNEYSQSERLTCTQVIHGDFWLSNMILDTSGRIVLVDMRGMVGDSLTLGGDPLYDYAKLYQSLFGYDCCLWNCDYEDDYRTTLLEHFHSKVGDKLPDIKMLSTTLMLGTLSAIDTDVARLRMWTWLMTHVSV